MHLDLVLDFEIVSVRLVLLFFSPVMCAVFLCFLFYRATDEYDIFNMRTELGACRRTHEERVRHKQVCTTENGLRGTKKNLSHPAGPPGDRTQGLWIRQ